MLAIFGSSLTASHASASLSGTAPIAGTVSGEGMTTLSVRCPTWMGGSGGDIALTLSIGGPLALDVEGDVGIVGGEGPE